MMISPSVILALAALATAHPGQSQEDLQAEGKARWSYIESLEKTDLAHCATKLATRGVVERTINRRKEALMNLRKRATGMLYLTYFSSTANVLQDGLQKRSDEYGFVEVLAKDHKSKLNLASTWKTADWTVLGQNRTTVLHPETTEGPFCKAVPSSADLD
jgi:hypothetical protein